MVAAFYGNPNTIFPASQRCGKLLMYQNRSVTSGNTDRLAFVGSLKDEGKQEKSVHILP